MGSQTGADWGKRAEGTAAYQDPEVPAPGNLGRGFDNKPNERDPSGALGAFVAATTVALAIGTAAMTGMISAPAAAAAGTVGVAGAGVYAVSGYIGGKGPTTRSDGFRKQTVDGLVEKGSEKTGASRQQFFDRLEQLFPGDKEQIRKARDAAEPKDEPPADGSAPASEPGAKADGETVERDPQPTGGDDVTAGSATLSEDERDAGGQE